MHPNGHAALQAAALVIAAKLPPMARTDNTGIDRQDLGLCYAMALSALTLRLLVRPSSAFVVGKPVELEHRDAPVIHLQ